MNLPLFYEANLTDETQFELSEESSRHIVQVLRMEEGDSFLLTNGKGQVLTVAIESAHKKKTKVTTIRKEFQPAAKPNISIAISLLKNTSRFEWFLEKATEIGITEIIPIICKRTEKTHFREDRMKSILISALLQSQQAWLPELSAPVKLETFLQNANYEQKFIAHCIDNEKKPLNHYNKTDQSQLILIGPEGDFTEDEIQIALSNNFLPVSLGDTRLRTETAGMVAAVMLRNQI